MVSQQLLQWFTILVLSWHPQSALSEQVCCCPDLTLSLSATESATTKSLQNGFTFVAKKGSAVTLKCDLSDKDHESVKSVVYKFHKTWGLSKSVPISRESKNKELCAGKNLATCELPDVKYTKSPESSDQIDSADNQIYQCYVEVTLKNDDVVMLWSHTIKLDVYYPPTKPAVTGPTDKINVNIGKNYEQLACDLPESNPKTKAQWYFTKTGESTEKLIDIPTDTVRGKRLVIAEDDISDTSKTDNIKRGMLLLMIISATEDQGVYKCKGVYDSVFDDEDTTFDITSYNFKTNEVTDPGQLQLRTVSAITEPKLVNQDSSVSFTVYARDTPGRDKWKDVSYTWQIKGEQDVDVDFNTYKDELSLSNNDRTLTVSKGNLIKHKDHEFHCKIKRTIDGEANPSEITSTSFGVKTDALVIAPKHLSIPLTSRNCVNHGDPLKTSSNKAYMMNTVALAGSNPEQILLKADSYKYYLNDYKVAFIVPDYAIGNYENASYAGVSQDKYASKLDATKNARCVYWQYLRGLSSQYQVIEVMRTDRLQSGCEKIDMKATFTTDMFEVNRKKDNDKIVEVTLKKTDTKITTNQCMKMHLVDSKDNVEDSKSLTTITGESQCSGRPFPEKVELTAKSTDDKEMKIKICPESSPYSAECFSMNVDAKSGGLNTGAIVGIVIGVVVPIAVIAGACYYTTKVKKCKGSGESGNNGTCKVTMNSVKHEEEDVESNENGLVEVDLKSGSPGEKVQSGESGENEYEVANP